MTAINRMKCKTKRRLKRGEEGDTTSIEAETELAQT